MSELTSFHADIKAILEQARSKARSAVNSAMVEALSIALTSDFGKGFSYANLYKFRQFYRVFPDQEILYTLCRKVSWSHNLSGIPTGSQNPRLWRPCHG